MDNRIERVAALANTAFYDSEKTRKYIDGARDMIVEGVNGYIVEKRDPERFADAMNSALALKEADKVSLGIADKYALKNLARDLGKVWSPLS